MFYDHGYMMGMHAWWWLFWVVLVAIALFSLRSSFFGSPQSTPEPARESPKAVLQRGLAAGEITPQQYEERQALLDRDKDKAQAR